MARKRRNPCAPLKAPQQPLWAYDPVQMARGAKVELEHTSNPHTARCITANHLDENPNYYKGLRVMERVLDLLPPWRRR